MSIATRAYASPTRTRMRRALRIGVAGIARTFTHGSRTAADQRTMGLVLGADEASHAAALFGGSVELVAHDASDVSAIVGDAAGCTIVAPHGVPYLNVACTSDALRHRCDVSLFHVAPSDAMRRDAVAGGRGEAFAWHPSLTRFGADTLNQRFLKRFGQPMTGDAWATWFALKVLWEASLRTRSAEPRVIAAFLADDNTQFDGHKGRPLSFRAWDHQLRQPLYVVDGDRVSEVPAARADDASSRASLDRLGERSAQSPCKD